MVVDNEGNTTIERGRKSMKGMKFTATEVEQASINIIDDEIFEVHEKGANCLLADLGLKRNSIGKYSRQFYQNCGAQHDM